LKLGTDRHHSKLLQGIDTLDDVGCFGLTELGYGKQAINFNNELISSNNNCQFDPNGSSRK